MPEGVRGLGHGVLPETMRRFPVVGGVGRHQGGQTLFEMGEIDVRKRTLRHAIAGFLARFLVLGVGLGERDDARGQSAQLVVQGFGGRHVFPQLCRSRLDREPKSPRYHLVLLAQNMAGYHNLLKLVTLGHTEGFHYKPRVDKELLGKYGEGLIALSACLKGEINQKLLKEGKDRAVAMAREYAALFPDRFYLEIQANGIPEQTTVNNFLVELSDHLKLPLVATNDCHYLHADDAEAGLHLEKAAHAIPEYRMIVCDDNPDTILHRHPPSATGSGA